MTWIVWVFTLVHGPANLCRHHFYKILVCIIFLLLATQYGMNVFFYRTNSYFAFNVSSWTSFYANEVPKKLVSDSVMEGSTTSMHLISPHPTARNTAALDSNSSSNHSISVSKNNTVKPKVKEKNEPMLNVSNNKETTTITYASLVSEESPTIQVMSTIPPSSLPKCPPVPPKLVGPVKVWTDAPSFEELEKLHPELELGGRFQPKECISRHKVAIIIPYRDREHHLRIFLHNIHPILQRQQLDYGIYVVEQKAKTKFNRAKLMNVGYAESLKQYDYQCFIFHDVDLLPEDDRNLYSCPEQPRHMSVAIDTFRYRLPYDRIFGGVSALNKTHMERINGFSNQFWGWGGEDDDMANRIIHHGYHISRYPANIARYKMLKHKKDEPNPDRYKMLYKGKQRFKTDGLNTLRYQRMDILLKRLYTWVQVDLLEKK